METFFKSGAPWDLKDGPVIKDTTIRQVVSDRLLGTIFTIATQLVEKTVVSVNDLEKGIKTSLAWPEGPFTLMNKIGMEQTRKLIIQVCYTGLFKMPEKFLSDIPEPWVT